MKKSLPLFAVVIVLLFITCDREWDNPFHDNNTLDPEAWAPENLQVETVSITERKLTWSYKGTSNFEGFKLDRKKGDESWQAAFATLPTETRSWDDTTLFPENGLTYQYRLYAFAGNNTSAEKTTSTEMEFPAPTDLAITKLSEISYKLEWTDNSTGEQGFKIDRRLGDEDWKIAHATLPANQTAFTDTNIFAGKAELNLEYRVYAFHGNTATAYISTETTASLSSPSELQITQNTINLVTLNWKRNSDGEEGFTVERKYETSDWTKIAQTKDTIFEDNDFEINTMVYYRVAAYTGEYNSPFIESSVDANIPPPTDLQLENLSDVSYKLTWKDNSVGEEGFKVDRKTGQGNWSVGFGAVGANVTSFVDTNVFVDKSSVHVEYRVYAFFDHFNSMYAGVNTSASLAPPENLQLTVNSQSAITLSWTHSGAGLHGFKIDKKTNEDAWQNEFAVLSPTQNSFADNSVNLEGNAYRYRVYAHFHNTYSEKVEKHISKPLVTTGSISNITGNTATGGGNVTSDGGSPVTQRGVCWSTNPNPTTANHTTNNGNGTGTFTSSLTNLSPVTTYYVRAYAISSAGTSYGAQVSFATNALLPTVITADISNITGNSATGGGNVTNDGGAPVTQRGVCWSTSPNPTIVNNTTNNGSGTGSFTSNLTSLSPGTTYYVRAYAISSAGTSYGVQVSFSTNALLPTVTTAGISNITGNSATGGGNVTNDGGSPVTQRGVCWSTSPNPTTANQKTIDGNGIGYFTSNISGLSIGTAYYVRAYAVNSEGTSYGSQISFSTPNLPTVTTANITNITGTSATGGGNVISDGGSSVTQRGVCWSTSPNPTIANHTTNNGNGTGGFISYLTNLNSVTNYFVRAYAINVAGISYGNQISFTTTPEIGDFHAGGIVFYLNGSGGGLVCAENDQNNYVEWGCLGTSIGGTGTSIGSGATNTISIITGCSQSGIAARICNDLILNGYSDWFLPSKDELYLMFINLKQQGIGNFLNYFYWSSSEYDANSAWCHDFTFGDQASTGKETWISVRAVRAF
jgi:hypothetical protein